MRRRIVLLALIAMLAMGLPASLAVGQAPPGPTVVYTSKLEVPAPPAQIDVVQVLVEFAPGTSVPSHTHGGQVLVLMTEGELNFAVKGSPQKTYKAGESWVENPVEFGAGGNSGSTTARLVATYLLPRGAPLSILEQAGATSDQLPPGPKTVYKSTLVVTQPPPQFDLVQMVIDFAPGAWTSQYPFGGQALGIVLSGGLTVRQPGAAEETRNPGDTLGKLAPDSQIGNAGTEPTRVVVGVLLPKGTPLALNPAAAAPSALPRTGAAQDAWRNRWLLLAAAALIAFRWLAMKYAKISS